MADCEDAACHGASVSVVRAELASGSPRLASDSVAPAIAKRKQNRTIP
jgi:hypothetical protein